ncbi:MAG: arabinogalactan endo,4-beta-galactosidase [Bacteroidota bacterium]|nr:arabinogalactan endo,4-beta-galactosidase [Bacteroidota bacterium]
MKKYLSIFGLLLLFVSQISCDNKDDSPTTTANADFIRAADLSFLPEIEAAGTKFNNGTKEEDMLTTLKNAGCNTIRIRIWKNPASGHSTLAEVKTFAARVKAAGLKVWITVHYSDSWADPGKQAIPAEWAALSFVDLKKAVKDYTTLIMNEINPDIIQIGNEINGGLLFPHGDINKELAQCLSLLKAGSDAVRANSSTTKIMIHFAGVEAAKTDWFFDKMKVIDYDYIGLSYYPIWHGTDLESVKTTVNALGRKYAKKVIIAETAYPFTLLWNDWTGNIFGEQKQLVPNYPATPEGQKDFVLAIKKIMQESKYGLGFAYWGGEWVAFKGTTSTTGSTFENAAFYDFNNKALPIISAFNQ